MLYPEFFSELGRDILVRLRLEASAYGLSEYEAQVWFEQEPTFKKQIVSALDSRREVTPLKNRRKGNSAHIPKTFQLTIRL